MCVLDSSSIPKAYVPASRRLEKAIRVFQLCYIFLIEAFQMTK
jgi:hypothetical protein